MLVKIKVLKAVSVYQKGDTAIVDDQIARTWKKGGYVKILHAEEEHTSPNRNQLAKARRRG